MPKKNMQHMYRMAIFEISINLIDLLTLLSKLNDQALITWQQVVDAFDG